MQQHLLHHGVPEAGEALGIAALNPVWPGAHSDSHVTSFQVHFLYQYSLQFFLDIYHNVLYENPNLKGATDHTQRLSIITKDLFQVESRACVCLV